MEFLIAAAVVGLFVVAVLGTAFTTIVNNLLYICQPNEVLIFSGRGERGYDVIKGGRRVRIPIIETVDRLDLTNMIIDVHIENAYSAGGIPLTVQGVANIKIGSQEHVLGHAVERLIGKNREEIQRMAKDILEGTLRGVLAKLTPEQVNEDKMAFAETLLRESEADLTRMGLVLDTMKVQNVHDDRGYLNSIGRIQSADIIRKARIAEANARAEATFRDAENRQRARLSEVEAEGQIARASAERRVQDALTRAQAMIAEQRGIVTAEIAKAEASIKVEEARVDQVRKRLEADVIEPARAAMAADVNAAQGRSASILEEGSATVNVLREMIGVWKAAGPDARDIFLMQKMESVMGALVETIDDVQVQRLTMLPGGAGGSDQTAVKAVKLVEELKAAIGVDLPQLMKQAVTRGGQPA